MHDLTHLGIPLTEMAEVYHCSISLEAYGQLNPSVVLIHFRNINVEAAERCSQGLIEAIRHQYSLTGKPVKIVWNFREPMRAEGLVILGIRKFLYLVSKGIEMGVIEKGVILLDAKKGTLIRLLLDHAKKRAESQYDMNLVFVESWHQI